MNSDVVKTLKAPIMALILAGFSLCAQGDPPKIIPLYNLQDNTSNDWTDTISINGVPVVHRVIGGGMTSLNGLVIDGDNRLDIEATQTKATDQPFEVVVFFGVPSDPFRTQVVTENAVPRQIGLGFHKSVHFKAQMPMRFPWQDGEHFDSLSPADQAAIFGKYQELVSATKTGNLDELAKLYEIPIRVGAMMVGKDTSESKAAFVKSFSESFAKKAGPLEIRDQNELKLKPCGQITLLCLKANPPGLGDWLLRFPTSKEAPDSGVQRSFSFHDLMFSKIKGQWKLVQ